MGTNIGNYHNSKQTPQLSLAPQLLDWLKILQVSTSDLSLMIQRELESNPALEQVDRKASPSLENGCAVESPFYGSEMHLDTGIADLEIVNREGELHVELRNDQLPKLQLSKRCKQLLKERRGSKEDLEIIRQKIREANFLIQGISQRQDTMLKVARHIMCAQQEYLSCPTGQLQPLTMNKVAAMIGVHETTVSRAIANKYVRTDRGVIDMRTFFKVGYRCADGTSVVAETVMEMVAGIIRDEDPMQPVIDSQISEHLKNFGLNVARRTVAKYREEMNIPSSKERLAMARSRAEENLPIAV